MEFQAPKCSCLFNRKFPEIGLPPVIILFRGIFSKKTKHFRDPHGNTQYSVVSKGSSTTTVRLKRCDLVGIHGIWGVPEIGLPPELDFLL